jgi:hypothetical protein
MDSQVLACKVLQAQTSKDFAEILRTFGEVHQYLIERAQTRPDRVSLPLHPFMVAMAHRVRNFILKPDSDYLRAIRTIESYLEKDNGSEEIIPALAQQPSPRTNNNPKSR